MIRWIVRIVAGLLGLLLLGAVYEAAAEAVDSRAFPPPGELIDLGGYRLHLDCEGSGSPTVVIDAGLGDWSASWKNRVQPAVAQSTRVCAYDRAGMGYSQVGPRPRTAQHFARELRTLLARANVPGPYVLVGHSMGGLTVRVFASTYASDVAGVVLIDSMSPGQARTTVPGVPPPADQPGEGDWLLTLPARVGVLRLLAGPLDLAGGLSPELARAYVARSVTPLAVQTSLDEGRGMPASLTQAGAVTSLGDAPLIVLSRGLDPNPDWQRFQQELLTLSTRSQQRVAERSSHNIQLDQPEAAVAAIEQMVEQVRR